MITLVTFLLAVLVTCIVVYAIRLLVEFLGLPRPMAILIYLIVAVIVLYWFLGWVGLAVPGTPLIH